ncbi:hypothetical protein GY45DRAFT_174953 [Cubamyces sp. BRFM 1775]|nr:hypothetical protein GY45DRAFT_174953 [Cubamyces sp. BRFM 1775]
MPNATGQVREREDGGHFGFPTKSVLDVLPLEILLLVLRHASDEKLTILACSLVSRSWREMSLPHLFSSLTIKRSFDYDDFIDFLASNPNLARYVRELKLGHLPVQSSIFPDRTIRPTLTPTSLSRITTKLPRLQALVLRSVRLDAGDDSDAHPTIVPRRLKELTIDDCIVRRDLPVPLQVLFSILTAYPANTISLLFLTLDYEVPFVPNTQHSGATAESIVKLEVESLVIKQAFSPTWPDSEAQLYDAFRQTLAPRCLRSLRAHASIHRPDSGALRILGDFFNHAGRDALRYLELPFSIGQEVGPPESRPDHWRVLRLDKCPNLEFVKVTIILPAPVSLRALHPPQVPLTTACIALMATLPRTLRTFALALWYMDKARVNDGVWLNLGELDEAVLTHFPSLEKVKIVLCACGGWVECTERVLDVMVKCRQRGILEVGPLDVIDYL